MNKKTIQKGGAFSPSDIESIRQKILELKQLSKDGIKECLSSVELSVTGSKQTLEDRLIKYVTSISLSEIDDEDISKNLETQESEISLKFDEVTEDTYDDLYTKVNPEEYC